MADTFTPQELYTCSSCTFEIPTHLARITCHSCPGHHLCANCHVIKAFNPPHTNSHSTMVFKLSGIVVPLPPGFAPRPPPALPPRPKSNVNEDSTQNSKGKGKEPELGTANWGALWSIMKSPLEKKGKKSRRSSAGVDEKVDAVDSKVVTGNNLPGEGESDELVASGGAGCPPLPPKSVEKGIKRVDSSAATIPSYPQPEKWEALFQADSNPTPVFIALMSTIFIHLDPDQTGFLSPETYSQFLETQGCVGSNIWKQALDREEGDGSKEVADLELSLYFTDLLISHKLSVRLRDPADFSDDEPQSAVEGKIRNSLRFNANMPMISRQGFIDVCAIEYLRDPPKAHEYLGKAMKEYGIWMDLGDIPREVLPEKSTQKLLRRETTAPEVNASKEEQASKTEERKDEKMEAIPVIELPGALNVEDIQRNLGNASKWNKAHEDSKISDEPDPVETPKLVSPITIGSPAIPFQLKGGDEKINALITGEGHNPSEVGGKGDSVESTLATADKATEQAEDTEGKAARKSKADEQGTKKPSTEDLYGAD